MGERYFDFDYIKGTEQEVGFLIELFGKDKTQKILDVGCGPGRHAVELAAAGYNLFGIDISNRLLEIAMQRSRERNVSPRFVLADAREIPFKNAFDWIYCLCEGAFGILESDADNQRVLTNVGQALKPGGFLLLNVLSASYIFRHPENDEEFDIERCVGYWTEYYTTEDGQQRKERCFNRYYTLPELSLLLDMAGLDLVDAWGCIAGNFQRKKLELDDFEFLAVAQKRE